MSEKETSDKAFRKKQRAVLNTVREACIYQSTLMISDGEETFLVPGVELKEKSFRDLDEVRTLILKGQFPKVEKNYFLKVEDGDEIVSIPLRRHTIEDSGQSNWYLNIAEVVDENRRRSSRRVSNESFFVPILFYFENPEFFPISGYARVIDYDERAISYEIRLPVSLGSQELKTGSFLFQEGILPFGSTKLFVDLIRKVSVEKHFDGFQSTANIVSKVVAFEKRTLDKDSIIVPKKQIRLKFRFFFREQNFSEITVLKLMTSGFLAEMPAEESIALPQYFVGEHLDTKIKFDVSNHEGAVIFRIAASDIGTKVSWYNFLTAAALGFQYRFKPQDVKDITRLMLESGGYNNKAISQLVLQHGYLQNKWPLEESLPKTKYRWLVKDPSGGAIGHTAGLRVSERIWAAIDNIGSQSYQGSWNQEYVAVWLRVFAEILEGHYTDPLIIWNYSPNAGIWNQFDRDIEEHPELVYCRDRIWSCFLSNVEESTNLKRGLITSEEVNSADYPNLRDFSEMAVDGLDLYKVIVNGQESPTYDLDFETDYSLKYKRRSFVLRKNGKPLYLLSISNYPTWASFNKGHDWVYLFELSPENRLSLEEEQVLFSSIKEITYQNSGIAYRIGLVSSKNSFSQGLEYINLLLKPAALEYAARTLERL